MHIFTHKYTFALLCIQTHSVLEMNKKETLGCCQEELQNLWSDYYSLFIPVAYDKVVHTQLSLSFLHNPLGCLHLFHAKTTTSRTAGCKRTGGGNVDSGHAEMLKKVHLKQKAEYLPAEETIFNLPQVHEQLVRK